MHNEDTRRDLHIPGRADDGAVFRRTMNITASGCRHIDGALRRNDYDDAVNIARRISNLWIDGHCAYQQMVKNATTETEELREARKSLVDMQMGLLACLQQMLRTTMAPSVRNAIAPLHMRILDVIPALIRY